MRQWWPYYAMMAPGLLFFFIWHYVPIWEAKMAFEQVRIIPLDWARRVVDLAEDQSGAFTVDGRMVDAPVIARARNILGKSGRR